MQNSLAASNIQLQGVHLLIKTVKEPTSQSSKRNNNEDEVQKLCLYRKVKWVQAILFKGNIKITRNERPNEYYSVHDMSRSVCRLSGILSAFISKTRSCFCMSAFGSNIITDSRPMSVVIPWHNIKSKTSLRLINVCFVLNDVPSTFHVLLLILYVFARHLLSVRHPYLWYLECISKENRKKGSLCGTYTQADTDNNV